MYNAIITALNELSSWFVAVFAICPCKGIVENKTAASPTMSSPSLRSTPSFLYDKDSRFKKSSRARHRRCLRTGLLVTSRTENSRSHTIRSLLHSNH